PGEPALAGAARQVRRGASHPRGVGDASRGGIRTRTAASSPSARIRASRKLCRDLESDLSQTNPDADGLQYFSDRGILRLLQLGPDVLDQARNLGSEQP